MALPLIPSISGALELLPSSSPWATHQKVFLTAAAIGATTLVVAALAEKFFLFAMGVLLVYTGLLGSQILKKTHTIAPMQDAKVTLSKAATGLNEIANTIAVSETTHGLVRERSASFSGASGAIDRDGLLGLLGRLAGLFPEFARLLKANDATYTESLVDSMPPSPKKPAKAQIDRPKDDADATDGFDPLTQSELAPAAANSDLLLSMSDEER